MNVARSGSCLLSLPEDADTLILIAFISKINLIYTFSKHGEEQDTVAGQSAVGLQLHQVKAATLQLLLPVLCSETTVPPHLSAQLLVLTSFVTFPHVVLSK